LLAGDTLESTQNRRTLVRQGNDERGTGVYKKINEDSEFIINAVSPSTAILSGHKKTRLAKLEQASPL
jgi:hypothetical protein